MVVMDVRSKNNEQRPLKVAMIAPPWLALPIRGYGGIELVIQNLINGLLELGIEVELFANGERKMKGIKTHSIYKKELFNTIDFPYYDAPLQIMQAHLNFSLKKIQEIGDFDIIHDHNPYIGPTYFSLASRIEGVPPILHTFHGPPFSTPETIMGGQADNKPQLNHMDLGNLYMVCISKAMARQAPHNLKPHMLDSVHNAIRISDFPYTENKGDYYITLARFTKDKGQSMAIKFATKYKKRLRMAGTVAGMGSNKKVLFEISNPISPYRSNEEFQYFNKKILPAVIRYRNITYAGNLSGDRKMKFISNAKALLFPIEWDEPFGMAVIEALACGTPVVAMKRGAMPEIIKHGKNGFLANNEKEFFEYANRVNEIDPAECRRSVEQLFSSKAMARQYILRYLESVKLSESK